MKFGQLVLCATAGCVGGLKDFVQLVSTGYGSAMALQAAVGLMVHRKKASKAAIAQALGVFAYGVRLAAFLAARARKPSYRKAVGDAVHERTKTIGLGPKLMTWASCSLLYACMFTPANAALSQAQASTTAKLGLPLLFAGLVLEAEADRQKSAAKDANPDKLVDTGLWSLSQHPNYVGEVTFWLGNWLAGFGLDQSAGQRFAGVVGLLSIWGIIGAESQKQSEKQLEKYKHSAAVVEYQARTPLLLPLKKLAPKVVEALPIEEANTDNKTVVVKAAAQPKGGEESCTPDQGIKAAKVDAPKLADVAKTTEDDSKDVAAQLVHGAIQRVIASLGTESTASSDDGEAKQQARAANGGGNKKKKGGKRK